MDPPLMSRATPPLVGMKSVCPGISNFLDPGQRNFYKKITKE
jgi:hypothetical protein